ncbi:bcl-2-like protein 10 [Ambystoma mexicanum]|uniref:bcl-2-like protein 10 n=1 Tax=Ambystoma mexicanum TaxID=8296 RepID=UPI0037E7517A
MPDSLSEETSQLLEDYFQYCSADACCSRPPANPKARLLRRVAGEVLASHQDFLRESCSSLEASGAEPGVVLRRVAQQMVEEGGLSWGRVAALIAFAGALAKRNSGCPETPRRLAAVLSQYLAQEQRDWLEKNAGWDGFYHFFNKSNALQENPNCGTYNAIIAAAGVGLAGLAFLLSVR